jgi:LPS-assembly protein
MKNNNKKIIFFSIIFSFFFVSLHAKNLKVNAKNISINKNNEITIFENDVVIITEDNNIINSDYAEYNKKLGLIKLKKNVVLIDNKKNILETNDALYNEKTKIFESIGKTLITTSEKYKIRGSNIIFNNLKKIISSDEKTIVNDEENYTIYLDRFNYHINTSIFKSIGLIKIKDKNNNLYEFSQIYIDTKKKETIGTESKIFINQEDFKVNKKNKPRIFSNTISINEEVSTFGKSIFTLCDYRENDKCPPWTIQSTKMLHDSKKKTIYYENAVIKVYDLPIFYLPKFSHPDPTVKRRSGFLPPTYSDTKNLGAGISIPYFWAIDESKNFTFTNRLQFSENPIFMGEYHQAFKNSFLMTDFGFTEGYKKTSATKKAGQKSHFFSKFVKNFSTDKYESILNINLQEVSNDKYLKLYKIKSNLVDYKKDNLENSLNYIFQEDDLFLGFNASSYETLKDSYNDKYEYILPEVTFDKNLISSNQIGNLDIQSNFKHHQYDTNKTTNFLINDLNWNFRDLRFKSGAKTKISGNLKNINYDAKNVKKFKSDPTNELFGALGYLNKLNLQKSNGGSTHYLTPKIFFRYAPGTMRNEESGSRLDPVKAFSLDRLNEVDNFETGLTSTLGFDYKIKNNDKNLDFSVAQIINEKENKKMSSISSMDEKLSDLAGSANMKFNENVGINYNFLIDQNYNDLNYNEVETVLDFSPIKFNFSYLEEAKHVGNQEYFKTKLGYTSGQSLLSFETKRNLVTDSSEFYNLSYEYLNDCLRAGLVYRREFYNDSELEAENSLMFKITLAPFGDINSQ